MLIEWREAKHRRWGTSEAPAFATPDGRMPVQPPTWLARAVRTLHASQQSGMLTLLAQRAGDVAFVQRLVEAAQDGTGRNDLATHVRWCAEADPEARADRFCQALLAWLLRDRALLANEADPRGLLAACATARAVEQARAKGLVAGLDLLARLAGGGEPARVALPATDDTAARQALVLRVRTALLLAGDSLEAGLISGFGSAPPLDLPLLAWLTAGDEPAAHPDALRLAGRIEREWQRPLLALGREVARRVPLPPLVALEHALGLEALLGAALAEERGGWRFDARAAQTALRAVPEDERAALQAAVAQRVGAELTGRAGRWAYEAQAGLVLTADDGRRHAVLVAAAKDDPLAALRAHEQWLGAFDERQRAALLAGAPEAVAAHWAPDLLLGWPERLLVWAAQHQPGAIATRWRALADPAPRRDTALHVATAAADHLHVLPLDLLASADAFPAAPPRLRELVALLGGAACPFELSPSEIDSAWYLGVAPDVVKRCSTAARSDWLRFFGQQVRDLKQAVPLTPELAQQVFEALPTTERDATLAALLRCAPEASALRVAVLAEFLRGGLNRARWEARLPEPTSALLVDALRLPVGPAPAQQPPTTDARVRFWRYVALRATTHGFTASAQARELIRADDSPETWRIAGAWMLAEGRDALLLDLWLYGPKGTLSGVEPPEQTERLIQEAVERRAEPMENDTTWGRLRQVVQRFNLALAWRERLMSQPAAALAELARDPDTLELAGELGWDLVTRLDARTWARKVWKAWPREPHLVRPALRSLSWQARLQLVEASAGQIGLDEALRAE